MLSLQEKLHGKNVVVQGITGSQGSFHTLAMLNYGTNIVGGTSPNLTKPEVHGVKVYQNLANIPEKIDVSIIFVPAPRASGRPRPSPTTLPQPPSRCRVGSR